MIKKFLHFLYFINNVSVIGACTFLSVTILSSILPQPIWYCKNIFYDLFETENELKT